MSKTESGYLVKIEAFIPADPTKPETMRDATEVLRMLKEHTVMVGLKDFGDGYIGLPGVTVSEPRWIARRRRDVDSITGCADDQGICKTVPASPQSAGGIARAEALSPDRRAEIARAAATARWVPAPRSAGPANEQAAQDSRAAGEGQTSPAAGEEMPEIPEHMRRAR